MRRRRMHGRRRVKRSPMKHLADDGTLLKAGGVEEEESEEATATTAKEESTKKSFWGQTSGDLIKEREDAEDGSDGGGQHTHEEDGSKGILKKSGIGGGMTSWWDRNFGRNFGQ